jgi:hypothetical protein
MLRKSIAWAIAVLILVQNFAFCQPAQATPFITSTTVISQVNGSADGEALTFSDTEEFYQELSGALKSGRPIDIKTPFNSYDEFPPRLKEVFELQKPRRSPTFPGMATAPIPNTDIAAYPASIHYGALASAGASAVIGAGVGGTAGSFVGGIGAAPGALAGAGIGLSSWAVSQAIINNCHKVVIQVTNGSLNITIEPVCPFVA